MSNINDFEIENGVLKKYRGTDAEVVIPEGVTSIGDSAFSGCESLTSITIPEGVTSIGHWAFNCCTSLTSIIIPEGVTSIGDSAFSGCESLTSITILESVTSIGDEAFQGCESLTSITIPEGVTSIGEGAFNGCKGLADEKGFVIFGGILFDYYGTDTSITIPEGVTSIGEEAFSGCTSLTSITIPNGVTSIGSHAFFNCTSLTSIIIPEGVTSIGEAFYNCTSLTSIIIPEGVTRIENSTFLRCGNLRCIIIPESVTSIGESAFEGCESLTSITIPEGVTTIENRTFFRCEKLTSITIPESVTSIGDEAFYGCKGLADEKGFVIFKGILFDYFGEETSITIPEGVTSIGGCALGGCVNLSSIIIPDEVPEGYLDHAFINAPSEALYAYIPRLFRAFSPDVLQTIVIKAGAIKVFKEEDILKAFLLFHDAASIKRMLAILTPSQIQGAAECMLTQLDDTDDAGIMDVFAKFIITFHVMIKDDTIKAIYRKMAAKASAEKAIKKMQKTGGLSDKLGTVTVETAKPQKTADKKPAMQTNSTAAFLSKVKLTPTMVLENAKSFYSISSFPRIKYADGSGEADMGLTAWLLTAHEKTDSDGDVVPEYGIGIRPEAAEAIAFLDKKSLQDALLALADENLGKSGRTKKMFLAYPICRYADEGTMEKLTKEAKTWRSSNSGNDAPPLLTFRKAALYSDTKSAMLFLDKYGDLYDYAKLRGMDAETLRDTVLSDVGLDAKGEKAYDLGSQLVIAKMNDDLSFIFITADGKTAKSLPKKGADEAMYETAKTDFDNMKKAVKKIIKARANILFSDFLSGKETAADKWQKAYTQNPVLRKVASTLVWEQGGSTFTIAEKGLITSDGKEYVMSKAKVKVAHPMEMAKDDVTSWQKYFTRTGIKQAFMQVWEPVYNKEAIKPNRYAGCEIPFYYFKDKEKHGIYAPEYSYEYYDTTVTFDDSYMTAGPVYNSGFSIDMPYEIKNVSWKVFSRAFNHIIAYLDRITVSGRARKDDVSIADFLPDFTLAQITDLLKVAQEAEAVKCVAVILDYKNKNFPDFDPMEEFTLDLI